MKKLLLLIAIGYGAWHYLLAPPASPVVSNLPADASLANSALLKLSARVKETVNRTARCDGRTYCSQMTSCAEARYFLANCPNTKMDGDHDGEPCEEQWCR